MQSLAFNPAVLNSIADMEAYAAVVMGEHTADHPLHCYAMGRQVARRLWSRHLAERCIGLATDAGETPGQTALYVAATMRGNPAALIACAAEQTSMGYYAATQLVEWGYLSGDDPTLLHGVDAMLSNNNSSGDHDPAWERVLAESLWINHRYGYWRDSCLQEGLSQLEPGLRSRAAYDLLLYRGIHVGAAT